MLRIIKVVLIIKMLFFLSSGLIAQGDSDSSQVNSGFETIFSLGCSYYNSNYRYLFDQVDMKSGYGPSVSLTTGTNNIRYLIFAGYYVISTTSRDPRNSYDLDGFCFGLGIRYQVNYKPIQPYAVVGFSANSFSLLNKNENLQYTARTYSNSYVDLDTQLGMAYQLSESIFVDFNLNQGFLLSEGRFSKTIITLGFAVTL